jgi:membrane protein
MEKHHTMAFAAALAYYFVVALFPFLIFLSAVVAHLPLPDFFSQVMGLIARVVPAANMGPLRILMKDTILSTHRSLLTFGILLTLWSASSGFTALIDALNAAYDVAETRRYWKTRSLAIGFTFSVGCLLNVECRFVSTLPGALIAVGGWIGLSYLLGIYFRDFFAYSKGYGSLGVALAFSIWLYWTGFFVLIGAQFNAGLLQEAWKRSVPAARTTREA